MNTKLIPLFSLGEVYMTAGISAFVKQHKVDLSPFIHKHHCGDWGCVCAEDKQENELSLKEGYRLLSAYTITIGKEETKIWIITEADR